MSFNLVVEKLQVFVDKKTVFIININQVNNKAIADVPDPHLVAAKNAGKILNKVKKVAVPLAIAVATAQAGIAVYKDGKNDTTRNIVETGASIAGGWGCGYGGAASGAAIGTAVCPGVGTIIGAIVGGVAGGIGGSVGAEKLVEAIGDELKYDLEERNCQTCQAIFKARFYKGERQQRLCPNCR